MSLSEPELYTFSNMLEDKSLRDDELLTLNAVNEELKSLNKLNKDLKRQNEMMLKEIRVLFNSPFHALKNTLLVFKRKLL